MAYFLAIALADFWSFIGTVIIIGMVFRGVTLFVVSTIRAFRRQPIITPPPGRPVQPSPNIVDQVRTAIARGEYDAEIGRAMNRNMKRRGQQ